MELVITLIKSFGLMMGISGGTLLVFGLAMIVWVRRNAKSKVFAFFVFTKSAFTKCLLIFKFQFILAEVTFDVVYIAAKLAPS